MIEVTLGGRLLPRAMFSQPSSLKSGYRGALAGSREAGGCSLDLRFVNGYRDGDLWFELGDPLVVTIQGVVWFRGVVTAITPPKRRGYVVPIEAVEDQGKCAELDGGMTQLGQMSNPELYCWQSGALAYPLGRDDRNNYLSAQSSLFRPGDQFLTEDAAGRRGYSKRMLFDTWGYRIGQVQNEQVARRAAVMYEQPVADLLARVQAVAVAQGVNISAVEVDFSAPGKVPQMQEPIRTDDGAQLLPDWDEEHGVPRMWGLFRRELPAARGIGQQLVTIYWKEVRLPDGDPAVEVYQLLNHSVARKLGKVRMSGWPEHLTIPGLGWAGVHTFEGARRWGPFGVHDNFENLIARTTISWYWMSGRATYDNELLKTVWERKACVYTVDLAQVLDERGEDLAVTRTDLSGSVAGNPATQDFIYSEAPGLYDLTSESAPLVEWRAVRDGGRYEISRQTGSLGPVFWLGNLYLSEIACEFDGTTVADMLHQVGLVTGSEWWIDGDGVLRFRRAAQASGTTEIRGTHFTSDDAPRRPASTDQADEAIGIPLSDRHQLAIRAQNTQTVLDRATRRITTFRPSSYDLPLGTELFVNGERLGKLVAKEADYPMVTVECE